MSSAVFLMQGNSSGSTGRPLLQVPLPAWRSKRGHSQQLFHRCQLDGLIRRYGMVAWVAPVFRSMPGPTKICRFVNHQRKILGRFHEHFRYINPLSWRKNKIIHFGYPSLWLQVVHNVNDVELFFCNRSLGRCLPFFGEDIVKGHGHIVDAFVVTICCFNRPGRSIWVTDARFQR